MSETNIPDDAADRIDEAIWRLAIEGLSQYDIDRIVRMVVLPEVAAERQRLHDRIEAQAEAHGATSDRLVRAGRLDAARPHALVADVLRALVSPVSDDTGGTKP